MTRVLCIDQASNNVGLTIVEIEGTKVKWIMASIIKLKGENPIIRTSQLYDKVEELVKEFGVTELVLEEVPLIRKTNINTTAVLLKVLGIMEMAGYKFCEKVHIMNINHWKHLAGITGKDRASQKSQSITLAMNRWEAYRSLIANSDDIADVLNMSLAWLTDQGLYTKK